MKRVLLALAALAQIAFASPSFAAPPSLLRSAGLPLPPSSNEVYCATGAAQPTNTSNAASGVATEMSRSTHVTTCACSYMRLGFVNYILTQEVGWPSNAPRRVRATIETASGAIPYRFTFSRNPTGGDITTGFMNTVPTGSVRTYTPTGILWSDPLKLPKPLPAATSFNLRVYQYGPTYISTQQANATTAGIQTDAGNISGANPSDKTASNVAVSNLLGNGVGFVPAAILCSGGSQAVVGVGDSIMFGTLLGSIPAGDINNDQKNGVIFHSAPSTIGFQNLGIPGAGMTVGTNSWAEQAPNHLALVPFATTVIHQLAINDLRINGTAAATIEANSTAYATNYYQNAKKRFITTATPANQSSDNWCTLGNQNAAVFDNGVASGARAAYNTWVRTTHTGYDDYIDVAAGMENDSAANDNKWAVTGCKTLSTIDTTNLSATITFDSGDLGPGDVGFGMFLPGVGAGATTLKVYLASVTPGACTVACTGGTLSSVASSTTSNVSGATVHTYTLDGVHPTPGATALGSAQVNWALMQWILIVPAFRRRRAANENDQAQQRAA